jgi:hypothetical protein
MLFHPANIICMPRSCSKLLHVLGHALCFVSLCGCSLGPKRIRTDWRQYNQSVTDIENQELLLNLVRLRYNEYPGVLRVTNIASQRNWSTSGTIGGTIPEGGPDTLAVGFNGLKSERPTVSFSPGGREMVAAALTPLSLDLLYLMSYMGWPASTTWPLMVKSVNGVKNWSSGSGPMPAYSPGVGEFVEVAISLRSLQDEGLVEVGRIEKLVPINEGIEADSVSGADRVAALESGHVFQASATDSELVLSKRKHATVLRFAAEAVGTPQHQDLLRLLSLDPSVMVFELAPAYEGYLKDKAASRQDIEIGMRSVFEMLFLLSRRVQVPECDLSCNVAPNVPTDIGNDLQSILGDFVVRSCDKRPSCASVAVQYRDSWFYIDSRDQDTKARFFLLKLILDTQIEIGGDEDAPLLTLPL